MAVVANELSSKMKLTMTVTDGEGNQKSSSKTFGNVRTYADNADVYAVAEGLGGLQVNTVSKISRINEAELTESE